MSGAVMVDPGMAHLVVANLVIADLVLALLFIGIAAALFGAVWLAVLAACVWPVGLVAGRGGGLAQQAEPRQRKPEAAAGGAVGGAVGSRVAHGGAPAGVDGAPKHAPPPAATNENGPTVP